MSEEYFNNYNIERQQENTENAENAAPEGQTFNYSEQGMDQNKKEEKPKKEKKVKERKPMTAGRRWASVVAMALVFGLVAGGTMFGVNTAAEHLTGRDKAQIGQTQTTSANADASDASDSGTQGTVAEVAQNAMPSLVTISTMSVEEMRNFFGGTQQYEVEGAGTGVIVGENDTELLIATNYHLVVGARRLSV